jgi:hypothetical protein
LIIFPHFGIMEILRPEKFGGHVDYHTYTAVENALPRVNNTLLI